MSAKIFPSLLSADLANLQRDIEAVADADGLHFDVMDGHFVPNMTMGPPVLQAVRRITDMFLDVHLMIDDPVRWAGSYIEAGADQVTFHVEAAQITVALVDQIRNSGCRVGIALRPTTSIEPFAGMLDRLDTVLLMTVEPGFGGQSFLEFTLPKIARTREMIEASGAPVSLEVDGGINAHTIEAAHRAGADSFVAGSAVFGAESPAAALAELRGLISDPAAIKAHPWAQRALTDRVQGE